MKQLPSLKAMQQDIAQVIDPKAAKAAGLAKLGDGLELLKSQLGQLHGDAESLRYLDPAPYAAAFSKVSAQVDASYQRFAATAKAVLGPVAPEALNAILTAAHMPLKEPYTESLKSLSAPAKNILQKVGRALSEGTLANMTELAAQQDAVGAKYTGVMREVMGVPAALGGATGKIVNGVVGGVGMALNVAGAIVDDPHVVAETWNKSKNLDGATVGHFAMTVGQLLVKSGVEAYEKRGLFSAATELVFTLAPQRMVGGMATLAARAATKVAPATFAMKATSTAATAGRFSALVQRFQDSLSRAKTGG